MIESTGRGVMDAPRGMTSWARSTLLPSLCNGASLSTCKLEDATPHAIFKPSRSSTTSRITKSSPLWDEGRV
jgi:hypothetical protein